MAHHKGIFRLCFDAYVVAVCACTSLKELVIFFFTIHHLHSSI